MENTNVPTEKKGNIEDLVAWQKAKELAVTAYKLVASINLDAVIKDKLIHSALEVSYSVARSYGVKQRAQSLENLYEARECIFEFKTAMAIAVDLGVVSHDQAAEVQPLVDHTDKLVSGLIQYKEDARKGKVRPKSNNYRGGNGNSDSGNVASDNFGNTIDYASSPVSNF
ncbi:MAG TPA: four helix bundle protein [Bacteroidia bacterium]|nr:four helix bundle protein [Bacteroidia bacterium]